MLIRLCAQFLFEVLVESFVSRLSHVEMSDEDHEIRTWLEKTNPSESPNAAECGTRIRDASNVSEGKRLALFLRMTNPFPSDTGSGSTYLM